MRGIIFIAILSFCSPEGFSQDGAGMMHADSITYNLYLQKNWDELIIKAEGAIKGGNDYYYMRMRLGIAYYEEQKYAKASENFSKALQFNSGDQIALEYLFYSYYLSGRYFQAWTVVTDLNSFNRERIIKESRFRKNSVTAETYYLNTDISEITASRGTAFKNPEAGSQAVTKFFSSNAIYFSHIIGKRTSYYHSFTNLYKKNIFHYFDGTSLSATMWEQAIIQNQYYGRLNFFTTNGWIFSPSFHFLAANYPFPAFTYSGTNFSVYTFDTRTNGYAGGFGVTKTNGYFSYYGEAIYSRLNKIAQMQGTLSLFYYPLGNQSVYLGGKASINYSGTVSPGARFIAGLTAGLSIKKRIFLEFSGLAGKMKNYSENNGLVVYNGLDYPVSNFSGKVSIPFYNPGITLFAGAGYGTYASEFAPSDRYNNIDPNKLSYTNYKVTGGISWNF